MIPHQRWFEQLGICLVTYLGMRYRLESQVQIQTVELWMEQRAALTLTSSAYLGNNVLCYADQLFGAIDSKVKDQILSQNATIKEQGN